MWSAFFPSAAPSEPLKKGAASPVGGLPVAMTVAGSDNSAGAGLQADLKTFSAHGVYGLTSVTCVVSEVPGLVSMIEPLSPTIVADQIRLGFQAFPVRAIKTGMLYSRPVIEAVAATLRDLRATAASPFALVVDPVMIASSGDPLLQPDAVEAYKELLFPLADVITPNLDEASVLLGRRIETIEQLEPAGCELAGRFQRPFLLKGGHLKGPEAIDLLISPAATTATPGGARIFSAPFVEGLSPHGTGCTYSAAIAACLAKGEPLDAAVGAAKRFISTAIIRHVRWASSQGETICLNHGPSLIEFRQEAAGA